MGIKAITSLTPINLYLQKIGDRSQLRAHSLPSNHILRSLISSCNEFPLHQHPILLNSLTRRQCDLIKGHLVDMDNCFNEVFPSFEFINPELFPSYKIIDTHANCFSFHPFSKWANHSINSQVQELDKIAIELLDAPLTALIILDASIKNNIATSITHTHIRDKLITKTLHHALNITSTEVELVAIKCGINQATSINYISKIIVVMDSIHVAKKIFDLSSHLFQMHVVAILRELCPFFFHYLDNYIKFWDCPSHSNQHLHKAVDSETKSMRLTPLYPNKLSQDFSRKLKCDNLANKWKITFQVSDLKDNQFLNLVNRDNNLLEPSYIKSSLWLQNFSHSNSLCTRVTRAITNYALIGKYRLRFFPNKEFKYPCGQCYKTRVWTDFGQGQGQPDIDRQIIISLQWRKST